MKNFILGGGTGRCGTKSLAKLLNGCQKVSATHEHKPRLPYVSSRKQQIIRHVQRWRAEAKKKGLTHVGDIAFYWLYGVEALAKKVKKPVKILFLKRDKEETVDSYMRHVRNRNHWQNHDGEYWNLDQVWDDKYPSFNVSDELEVEVQRKKAIKKYYDFYYKKASIMIEMNSFVGEIMDMDNLNSKEGQDKIFDFYEISQAQREYKEDCRYNVNRA